MSVNEMFRIIIKGISHILSHSLSNGIFSEIRVPMRGSPDATDRDEKRIRETASVINARKNYASLWLDKESTDWD